MARGFARHRAWNRKTQQPKIKQTSQAMAPHDQQTNKPTHHNWSENPPTKISVKTMEVAPESALEAALELLGTILASKKPQEPKKHRTQPLLDPPPTTLDPPNWISKSIQNKSGVFATKRILFLIGFWVMFWCHLVPVGFQLGRQSLLKTDTGWLRHWSKMASKF